MGLEFNIVAFICLLLLVIYLLPKFNSVNQLPFKTSKFFLLGIIALIICLFPHWILGLIPKYAVWESRHQLLMPFGMSIIFGSFYCFFSIQNKRRYLVLIITLSIATNTTNYLELFRDWNKQKSVVIALENSNLNLVNKTVYIEDNTFNAWGRIFRSDEWEGLFRYSHNGPKYSSSTIIFSGAINGVSKNDCIDMECIFISFDYEKNNKILDHDIERSPFGDVLGIVVRSAEKIKIFFFPHVILKVRLEE